MNNLSPWIFCSADQINASFLNDQECSGSSAVLVSFLKDPNQHGENDKTSIHPHQDFRVQLIPSPELC